MEKDLFTNLPSEIKLEILSRLPIGSVFKCKLVDRSWHSLIESPEFAKSYKSAPCLAFELPCSYKVYEVEDGDENSKNSCKEAFNFNFAHPVALHSSINGLLLFIPRYEMEYDMFICNPVIREYITIPRPKVVDCHGYDNYGFGVSRNSGQFKVVRVFIQRTLGHDFRTAHAGCQVYTLGTGRWRNAPQGSLVYFGFGRWAFLNGNLHWLAYGSRLSCFDLETEVFTLLHAPRLAFMSNCSLHVIRDCLGIYDASSVDETVIWLMKDYGDDKSWTKQFVIPTTCGVMHVLCGVMHVFKDGDILLKDWLVSNNITLCYSNKTKAIEVTNLIKLPQSVSTLPISYAPSFVPLKTFSSMENFSSFMPTHFC